ncbi:MAG: nicotinamide riboside transporter PnuC [Rikenellaceae bacterium]
MNFPLLEVIGTLIGILYVVLEYRASVWLWPVGVVMPFVYIFIYYQAGIYANMGINVYFLIAAIYGWIVWCKGKTKPKVNTAGNVENAEVVEISVEDGQPIVYTSKREWLWCSVVFAATFALLAYILVNFTPSTVPYSDSFTTALSVVGMWMLAHKRIEHWILWIIVDAVSAVMYINKALYPTSGLYILYTIVAIAGYIKWQKMMKAERS